MSEQDQNQMTHEEKHSFQEKAKSLTAYATFTAIAALLLWYTADLILLLFLSILFAILLHGLSDPLADKAKLNPRVSLWIVITLIIIGWTIIGFLFYPQISEQSQELADQIPEAFSDLKTNLEEKGFDKYLVQIFKEVDQLIRQPGVLSQATSVLSATLGFLSSILIVIVTGTFLANNPSLYLNGLIRLFHPDKRPRMREVLSSVHETMRWWLFGKILGMTVIGLMTGIGLQIIGVKLALILGLIAGVLAFIPYIGPLAAAIPAILLAFVDNAQAALYVVILYGAVQLIEGNVMTPVIEKKTVHLPPALTIFSQLLGALLFGFLGILLAPPLMASTVVFVKMLYIEDKLEGGGATT